MSITDDPCFYCVNNLIHPVVTADDDAVKKAQQRIYNDERYRAQGTLTASNSIINAIKRNYGLRGYARVLTVLKG